MIFSVPDSDGQMLLSEILGEFFVLLGLPSLEWVHLERYRETPVENLLDGRLARIEKTQLVLLHQVVLFG